MSEQDNATILTKSGQRYDWVHVNVLREFFKTNLGQPFKFWAIPDFEEFVDEIDDDAQHLFIPDGYLIKEENGKETVYENWLGGEEKGPYTATSSEETFYYLSGQLKMDGEPEYMKYKMQVCLRPMNYLSEDALDGCDVWVRSSESIQQPRRSERLKKLNKK